MLRLLRKALLFPVAERAPSSVVDCQLSNSTVDEEEDYLSQCARSAKSTSSSLFSFSLSSSSSSSRSNSKKKHSPRSCPPSCNPSPDAQDDSYRRVACSSSSSLSISRRDLTLRSHVEKRLCDSIELYLRTLPTFDSEHPLAFVCAVADLLADEEVFCAFQALKHLMPKIEDLSQFLRICPQFVLQKTVEGHDSAATLTDGTDSQELISLAHLTPYQGDALCCRYGYFHCSHCRAEWTSTVSWKDKWMRCAACSHNCYPYSQVEVDDVFLCQTHDMNRCQACLERGLCCTYYALRNRVHSQSVSSKSASAPPV